MQRISIGLSTQQVKLFEPAASLLKDSGIVDGGWNSIDTDVVLATCLASTADIRKLISSQIMLGTFTRMKGSEILRQRKIPSVNYHNYFLSFFFTFVNAY